MAGKALAVVVVARAAEALATRVAVVCPMMAARPSRPRRVTSRERSRVEHKAGSQHPSAASTATRQGILQMTARIHAFTGTAVAVATA